MHCSSRSIYTPPPSLKKIEEGEGGLRNSGREGRGEGQANLEISEGWGSLGQNPFRGGGGGGNQYFLFYPFNNSMRQ